MGSRGNTFNPTFQSSVFAGDATKSSFVTSNALFYAPTNQNIQTNVKTSRSTNEAAGTLSNQDSNHDRKRFAMLSTDNMFVDLTTHRCKHPLVSKPVVENHIPELNGVMATKRADSNILTEQDYMQNYKKVLDNQIESQRNLNSNLYKIDNYDPKMASLAIEDKQVDNGRELTRFLNQQMDEKRNFLKNKSQQKLDYEQKIIESQRKNDISNKKELYDRDQEAQEKYAELRKVDLNEKLMRKRLNMKVQRETDVKMESAIQQQAMEQVAVEQKHSMNLRKNYDGILTNQMNEKLQRQKLAKELDLKSEFERVQAIRSWTEEANKKVVNEEFEM